MLEVKGLKAQINDQSILKGIDLSLAAGEVQVIMGPNGSGKSTLANVLMGHPKYVISGGEIKWERQVINDLAPEERAALGMFMSFQYPREIMGVPLNQFLYLAYNEIAKARDPQCVSLSVFDFEKKLQTIAARLNIKPEFLSRSLNYGFSGGEKKKMEMLQLYVLEPKLAILDETDSGLDVDALKVIGEAANDWRNDKRSILLITHYNRILRYLKPDKIHIMVDGQIIKSGNADLAEEIEEKGYQHLIKQ